MVRTLLQPILESAESVQLTVRTVAAVLTFCLGSLLTLAGAVVMLLQLPPRLPTARSER